MQNDANAPQGFLRPRNEPSLTLDQSRYFAFVRVFCRAFLDMDREQIKASSMYKLGFYVPQQQLDEVKQAVFAAGAGNIGDYEHCCWQCPGRGQFRPGPAANPFIGEPGTLEYVDEYRVEMVVADHCIHAVVAALKAAHPYEEPAFDIVKLVSEDDLPV